MLKNCSISSFSFRSSPIILGPQEKNSFTLLESYRFTFMSLITFSAVIEAIPKSQNMLSIKSLIASKQNSPYYHDTKLLKTYSFHKDVYQLVYRLELFYRNLEFPIDPKKLQQKYKVHPQL